MFGALNGKTLNSALLREALGTSACHGCGADLGLREVADGDPIPMTHVDDDGRWLCTPCAEGQAGRDGKELR